MTRAADLAKLIAGGGTITVADNSTNITLKSTDDDANGGPVFDLTRDSASPADSDTMGTIRFRSDDDGGNETQFVDITGFAPDVSDGSEDGQLQIRTIVGGTLRNRLDLASGETVFNEDSVDVDFRVESNGNANMLVIDGGNNIASIGRAVNSSSTLAIQNKDDTNNNAIDVYNDNGNRNLSIQQDTSGNAKVKFFKNDGTLTTTIDANLGGILFGTDTASANTLDDYEEGTWVPALVGPSSVAYSSQIGNYTKIGRMVFLSFSMTISTAPTGNSNYRILIPFTPEGTSTREYGGDIFMDTALVTSNYGHFLGVYLGTTNVYVYTSAGSARSGSGAWQTGTLSGHIFINT